MATYVAGDTTPQTDAISAMDDRDKPQRPRVTPEIIPPDRGSQRPVWGAQRYGAMHRVYVAKLPLFGGVLLLLAIIVAAVMVLLAFVGALLIWIPIVALVVAVAAFSGLLRPRRW
jgi:hypothetical protein